MSSSEERAKIYAKARRHLARRDPALKAVMAKVGPCTLEPHSDYFLILVRSIVSQMISTAAAKTIFLRIQDALHEKVVTPRSLRLASEEQLRTAGLSRAKVASMHDLARRVEEGELPLDRLHEMTDEDIYDHLVAVKGIGRWTAEMFLIFSLGRLDVLPVGDLGLRAGVKDLDGLNDLPSIAMVRERGAIWAPYRSIATWYLWRSRGPTPESK